MYTPHLVDRALHVPRSWTEDRDRCAAAEIGNDTAFATKPQLAQRVIERTLAAGLPFAWFTADDA
jgi:SRSO17 transposase